ncbi:fructokinase [Roseateles sp. DAIF2]|uniref:PfkB family carbohydrate kinase n=1 Tax=Roseateles sp. DAIF2 TaxID=2714952 RepID=UPI0018A248DA|nr:PfkB family carbohydrate kinase [Roseateles sp. DAIF2]QPF73418.1 fructokinase [Roseateles sp. DAIF2]
MDILVLGEALVDEFASGPVAGGAPFNLARSLAALGLAPLFVGRIGAADPAGALLLASLRRFGMDESGLQCDAEHASGRVRVLESPGGTDHRFVIEPDAAWDHLELAPVRALLAGRPAPRALCFGTLAQRAPVSRASLRALIADFPRGGETLRYLDLNLREGADDPELAAWNLAHADWLKVNEEELARLLAWFAPDVPALMARFGLQRLVLTRGAAGYACYDAAGRCLAEGPGLPLARLVDTVGAGDGFSAMLLAAHLQGRALPATLELANRYAAALCEARGPLPEADEFFTAWRSACRQQGG